MNDDLRDLYQEVILDHGRHPRNRRIIEDANHHAHGENPLCGDKLMVFLKVNAAGVIDDVSFEGKGCAISTASASLMTEVVVGKTQKQAEDLFAAFHALTTGGEPPVLPEDLEDDFDRLCVLAGVRDYPVRVKCATLAWHTLEAAMHDAQKVTTE
ncbi:Fe-S cluster assembly sulfur transfer protein SufU [Telmatospirillum sp.]|uniref:Fe-S cluster assembly sulfur transfer protein SufU n=1 Tax=Telmatospirillum sp. TaxID=2079197 RepID=UPI002845A7A9|nr:SUF system NifU family Fe-S cluster assembly protein [Telmatospirillum sp.]MDR3440476.1 SUF system NifU family Fe-S cluster assembly protein [Telmatospirillum sp.]